MIPTTGLDLLELVAKSGLLQPAVVQRWQKQCIPEATAETIAKAMVDTGVLTDWHIGLLLRGKWKGFFVDQYCLWKLIETDTTRGIQVYNVIDRKTGLPLIMELVPPQRARTKSDSLFYIVRIEGKRNKALEHSRVGCRFFQWLINRRGDGQHRR